MHARDSKIGFGYVATAFFNLQRMKHGPGDEILEDARLLRASVARLQRRLRGERKSTGIGLAKYGTLSCLHREGPLSAGDLAARQHLQPQSVTRILADLDRRHLITRRADPADGRRWKIEISVRGVIALADYAREQEAWLAEALSRQLSPAERALLRAAVELMDRLALEPGDAADRTTNLAARA